MGEGVKSYKTYAEQVSLLESRGMKIEDPEAAIWILRRVYYYRLSGYWYPFRKQTLSGRADDFYSGTRFRDVVALYEFDMRLRAATFTALAPIELAIRAQLGHELGKIDPCVHLDPSLLGPVARRGDTYSKWLSRYANELRHSREDFVDHHRQKYGGRLPVWAATELLDWGSLTYLYSFSPRSVQDAIAGTCGLRAPQLASWLKALNLVRNTCAHHGRLFNRVHTIAPKLPRVGLHPDLDTAATEWNRTFARLTLIRFLSDRLQVGRAWVLPAVVKTFPNVTIIPMSHLGAPSNWQENPLWAMS